MFREALRFFVFTNLFIATCVLCFTSKTALMLYGNCGDWHVNLLAFSATVFLYGFHRLYRRFRLNAEEHQEERHKWVDERKKLVVSVIIIAFVVAVSQLLLMPLRVWYILVPPGIIAGGYSVPFIKTQKGYIRLRDISWLKALWIGIAYAWLTTFLPVAYSHPLRYLLHPDVAFIFAENLLFMFVLAVPFDIRDLEYDKQNNVHTVPVLLGVKGAIRVCLIVLMFYLSLVFFHVQYGALNQSMAMALFVSAVEVAAFIPFSRPERPNLFFPMAIESSMIIQWALVLLVYKMGW